MATLEAWKRFVSHEPQGQIEYRTIEVWHPDFDQAYRFVNEYTNQSFIIESGAPRNAGETVVFDAANLNIVEPAERNDGEQVLSIRMGDVDDRLNGIIDSITGVGFLSVVEVIYRKYYSGDLSAPVTAPLYFQASSLAFDGAGKVTFTAEDSNLSKKRPGALYLLENFPGLA